MFKLAAVTDAASCPRPLGEQLARIAAYQYAPEAFILRAKKLNADEYAALARRAASLLQNTPVKLFLHGHWRLARELGVTRLHLPLGELLALPPQARNYFRELSCSVHSEDEARQALAAGATRLVAGHIYATACKPGLPPRGLDFLRKICHVSSAPVYAIGGVKFDAAQWRELEACGAAGACIMSAYMRV